MNPHLRLLALFALPACLAFAAGCGGGGARFEEVDSEATLCVELARAASSGFGDDVSRLGLPAYDPDTWDATLYRAEDRMAEAEDACGCPEPACEKAAEALAELAGVVSQMDGLARGDETAFGNPATLQERTNQLLNDAEALLP